MDGGLVSAIWKLIRGSNSKQSELLFNQWKVMYEVQEKKANDLEIKLDEAMRQLQENSKKVVKLIEMEEDCLKQNVRANELNRSLAEYIIFSDEPGRQESLKTAIGKLLK